MQGSDGTGAQVPSKGFAIDRRTVFKVSGGTIAAAVMGSAAALDVAAQETSMEEGFQFFTTGMARTVGAIAEQYWPTTDASPGAIEAGVVTYIDRALAGAYVDYQNMYRAGLVWLDAASQDNMEANFANLEPAQQLELLTGIFDETITDATAIVTAEQTGGVPVEPVATPMVDEGGAVEDDGKGGVIAGGSGPQTATLLGFLNVVRTHTMEGLFSDPVHGGNRDFAGWAAVGYPGPYIFYDAEQQQSFEPLNQPLQSIADL